jgi:hypothetical protein
VSQSYDTAVVCWLRAARHSARLGGLRALGSRFPCAAERPGFSFARYSVRLIVEVVWVLDIGFDKNREIVRKNLARFVGCRQSVCARTFFCECDAI